MDIQKALVDALMRTGDVRTLRVYNLLPEMFTSEEAKVLLKFCLEQHESTGAMPSRELVRRYAPDIEFVESTDSIETLCQHVAHELADTEYRRLLAKAEDFRQRLGSMDAAQMMSQEFISLVSKFGRTDTYLVGSRPDAEFREMTSRSQRSTRVIPYIWSSFQKVTGGHRGGQLVLIYGRLKHGKTWALLEQAHFVATVLKKKVLFISPEMPASEIYERLYALECRFDYSRVVNQDLYYADDAKENKLRLQKAIYKFHKLKTIVIHSSIDDGRPLTVELLHGLVDQFDPDYVVVDQIQEMDTVRVYRVGQERFRLGELTKGLKRLGMTKDVPVMASTQRHRPPSGKKVDTKNDDADDISEADKIGQTVDIAIRIRLNKEAMIRYFDVAAARNLVMEGWVTNVKCCTDMSEIQSDQARAAAEACSPKKPPPKKKQSVPKAAKTLFGGA